jgi:hypothetical protein
MFLIFVDFFLIKGLIDFLLKIFQKPVNLIKIFKSFLNVSLCASNLGDFSAGLYKKIVFKSINFINNNPFFFFQYSIFHLEVFEGPGFWDAKKDVCSSWLT